MSDEPLPPVSQDVCVWCGARPLRVGFAEEPLAWLGGARDCEHETLRGE